MEMNGGSSAPYLARTPCVPLFNLSNRAGTEGLSDCQGRAGIIPLCRGTFAQSYSVSSLVYFTSSLRARTAKTLICTKKVGFRPIPERAPKVRKTALFAYFLHIFYTKNAVLHTFWRSFWNRRNPTFCAH